MRPSGPRGACEFTARHEPQLAEGGELVIVDLRHTTIMPPPWPEHRAAALAGVTRDSIYI
jgi:hypothetical protein